MTRCPECGYDEVEVKKEVVENEVREGGTYCPDCQSNFKETEVLQWDEIDFPVWLSYESYDDGFGLLRDFEHKTGLHRGDYDGMPNVRNFKYTVFHVYFKIEEDGSISGPYAEKGDEEEMA